MFDTHVGLLAVLFHGLGSAQPLAANGNALYTMLGAGIAAMAGLVSVGMKYLFDSKAEASRHAHEMKKLELELDAQRAAVDQDRRSKCIASVLAVTSSLYDHVRTTRRLRREGEIDDREYVSRLRFASVEGGQTAVEELRLACPPTTAETADALWSHLRGEAVPRGTTLTSSEWVAWKAEYWRLRHELITGYQRSEDGEVGERPRRHGRTEGEREAPL